MEMMDFIEHLPVFAFLAESFISLMRLLDCFVGESDNSIKVAGKR
jgi:hypothetical protein